MQPRSLKALALAALLAVISLTALVALPGTASAHSALVSTAPAAGSTVDTPPDRVSLTFNEVVWADYATVVVTRAGGGHITTGPPEVEGMTLSVTTTGVTNGAYDVAWRVVSADGHPITGQFSFTVAETPSTPTSGTSTPGAPGAPVSGTPVTGAPGAVTGAATPGPGATDPAPAPPAGAPPPQDGGNAWIIGVVIAGLAVVGGAVLLIRRNRERPQ